MARIRVIPEDLLNQAHEIAGLCISVMNEANRVLKISRSAPPYNGQFGPIVRAIGDSAHSLGRIRSESVKETGIRLTGISEAFIEVDNFAIYSDSLKNMCFDNEYDVYYTEEEKRIKKLFPNWVKGQDPDVGTDAFLLWAVLNTADNGNGFRLIQVGENEWTILVTQTHGEIENINHPESSNSWLNTICAMLGIPTQFELRILDEIFNSIPAGSKLNLVGYSQGGMIAVNMYEDLKDRYNIGSYTTFASPMPKCVEKPPIEVSRNYRIGVDPVFGDLVVHLSDLVHYNWGLAKILIENYSKAKGLFDKETLENIISYMDNNTTEYDDIYKDPYYESPDEVFEYIYLEAESGDLSAANHYPDNYYNNETVRTASSAFNFGTDELTSIVVEREPYDFTLNQVLIKESAESSKDGQRIVFYPDDVMNSVAYEDSYNNIA